jgi:NitT/TauT family transport system permease protein
MNNILSLFRPNTRPERPVWFGMVAFQIILALAIWFLAKSPLLPSPVEILAAAQRLITQDTLLQELFTSLWLSVKSMAIAIVISLIISYATVMPFFRPLAFLVSKFRFLTLVGLSFVFTMMTSSGHGLKVSLMTFGISVFFVTNMVAVIQGIPKSEFNHARTLRMSEWQVVWQVIILGKLDHVFEIIRQNFAISWMMLTMVEGISRSEGGIGTMLLNQNKYLHLDAVFAIQVIILLVGVGLDLLIGFAKNLFCPYASLTIEKR